MDRLIEFLVQHPDLANAVGAVTSAIAAFFAVIVSLISVVVSVRAINVQKQHNRLSVRPMPEISVADYEDCIRVKLRNNGTGPLKILNVSISDGKQTRSSLIELMPALSTGRAWSTFSNDLAGRAIVAADFIPMLELKEISGEPNFCDVREPVRKALKVLTVTVCYTDIYGTNFKPYEKKLDWFGR